VLSFEMCYIRDQDRIVYHDHRFPLDNISLGRWEVASDQECHLCDWLSATLATIFFFVHKKHKKIKILSDKSK